MSSHGEVYYCATCANCENFLSERIASSRVMVIMNGHQSCDLTPCDFFPWGTAKSLVYVNKPRKIRDLKEEIRRVCQTVIANFTDRVVACQRCRGGHMPDIIFHTLNGKVD